MIFKNQLNSIDRSLEGWLVRWIEIPRTLLGSSAIEILDSKKEFYIKEIKKDLEEKKSLETIDGLEKYAREKYYMKSKNEDIFLIESDTTKR